MQAIRDNRRFVLIGVMLLLLLCLVVFLIIRIFFEGDGGEVVEGATPTPALIETAPPAATPEEAASPTPTRVVSGASPTSESPATPAASPPTTLTPALSLSPTATPTGGSRVVVTPVPGMAAATPGQTTMTGPGPIEQLLENGDFEDGFDETGVALSWNSFKNDAAVVIFAAETAPPFVKSGSTAQRVVVVQATQGNRYAGLYQAVEVVPNQPYTLTLNGQVRTGLGDIVASSYGYRVQYALDDRGGSNWQAIPDENWVELPWDEQRFDAPEPQFLGYTTTITPTSDSLTLFVRTWNKWADPGEVQYTFDSFSLIGPSAAEVILTAAPSPQAGEQLIDNGLPTTGVGDSPGYIYDGRFWGGVLVLALLAGGAMFRARRHRG